MSQVITNNKGEVVLDKERFLSLEKKAAVLDELVSFIEDRVLGDLMQETEGEGNISLDKACKVINES